MFPRSVMICVMFPDKWSCIWYNTRLKSSNSSILYAHNRAETEHGKRTNPFPLSFSQGLRVTAICGAFGTCLGAWIKVFSVQQDLFYVGFIGQSVVAAAQVSLAFAN